MKDPRQGSAAIVFLVFYTLTLAWHLYCLFTRRAKRYIFSVFTFNVIRVGANIASLGWAIHLYDNFDWLIASLILGTEGYFALVLGVLFLIVGYEKETFGTSMLYPDIPKGRNKCLHRFTHIAFWFEWSLIPANVLLIVGGSMVTGGLSRATPEELLNPRSISRVKTGQNLRIVGQCLFFAAIIAAYFLVAWVARKAQRLGKPKEALWWLAATSPFLIIRGAYGIVSAADWQYSYYLPTNYGENGLNQKELVGEYIMSITTEAITMLFLLRATWLVTMPKHLFVPYDKRGKRSDEDNEEAGEGEGEAELMESRSKSRTAQEA